MHTADAGTNKTLPCPGVNEHSLVQALEWSSRGKLVEYMGETTTVWKNRQRISLLADSFALHFQPVRAEDSGDYVCLVNSRPKPDAIVRLIVQGKQLFSLLVCIVCCAFVILYVTLRAHNLLRLLIQYFLVNINIPLYSLNIYL